MDTEIGQNESVSTAVFRAVSAVNGREPDSLRPLTDVIDPDALDALFAPRPNGTARAGGCLSFSYSGCHITIDNGEYLTIEPFETTGLRPAEPDGTDRAERDRSDESTQPPSARWSRGSRVCFVCQQPIQRENLEREREELVHTKCRPDLRCGIWLEKWPER